MLISPTWFLKLSFKNETENDVNKNLYQTISNDTKIETEIYNTVENIRNDLYDENDKLKDKFNYLSFPNYIIQSNIHVNILDKKNITGTISDNRFNLFRIFDNFTVNETYPFMQYLSFDNELTHKLFKKSSVILDQERIEKWFETAPYGLNFKVKINSEKFINVSLLETGRIEYKITWKEPEQATVDDITKSYDLIKDLLTKINQENKSIKIVLPKDNRFNYEFINSYVNIIIISFRFANKFINII